MELMIVVAIIGILAAIAIPSFFKARDEMLAGGPVACLQNMLQIAEGVDPTELECPVSKKIYTVTHSDRRDVLVCPDPEQHLSYSPHFFREGGSWRFTVELPKAAPLRGQSMEFATWTKAYSIENGTEQILVRIRRRGLLRFVWSPVLLLVGVGLAFVLGIALITGALELWDTLIGLMREGKGAKILSILGATVFVLALISFGAFLTFRLLHAGANGLFSQSGEVTISKTDGDIHIRNFAFGRPSEETETIENTKLFFPMSGRLLVIYEDGELLQHQFLRTGGREGAEVVAQMLLAPE
jgi:hypothetical protein